MSLWRDSAHDVRVYIPLPSGETALSCVSGRYVRAGLQRPLLQMPRWNFNEILSGVPANLIKHRSNTRFFPGDDPRNKLSYGRIGREIVNRPRGPDVRCKQRTLPGSDNSAAGGDKDIPGRRFIAMKQGF